MAYRFTNTEKWNDSWFSQLTQLQMLLFIYLCDNCDIAGFIEVNTKRWAADLSSTPSTIEGALKGLQRGLIFSKEKDAIFIRNFLRHQKNLPLNANNKAHLGILRRFEVYSQKFEIEDVTRWLEGASKGLQSPTGNGIGIGNGIGNGIGKEKKGKNSKIDYNLILEKFNQTCPHLPQVKTLTDTRRAAIRARVEEYDLETMFAVFEMAGESNMLNGDNNRGWMASLDWIIKPANFAKIMEGNYANRPAPKKEESNFERAQRIFDETIHIFETSKIA